MYGNQKLGKWNIFFNNWVVSQPEWIICICLILFYSLPTLHAFGCEVTVLSVREKFFDTTSRSKNVSEIFGTAERMKRKPFRTCTQSITRMHYRNAASTPKRKNRDIPRFLTCSDGTTCKKTRNITGVSCRILRQRVRKQQTNER